MVGTRGPPRHGGTGTSTLPSSLGMALHKRRTDFTLVQSPAPSREQGLGKRVSPPARRVC